jgi:hypothetical protein
MNVLGYNKDKSWIIIISTPNKMEKIFRILMVQNGLETNYKWMMDGIQVSIPNLYKSAVWISMGYPGRWNGLNGKHW